MRNRLLNFLGAADRDLMTPYLTPVDLPVRTVIQPPNVPIEHAYFIERGLASLITIAGDERIEVGVFGVEGMVGLPLILGAGETPHEGIMQLTGSALRIGATDLRLCMEQSPSLTAALLRFVHVAMIQVSHTALANGRQTVEQRLARWLLMVHDRIDGDEIALTHEFLAVMLGVRRPGVTVALHILEGEHAVRSRRNSITVTDRGKLKAIAGPSYGASEAIYEKLFGPILPTD